MNIRYLVLAVLVTFMAVNVAGISQLYAQQNSTVEEKISEAIRLKVEVHDISGAMTAIEEALTFDPMNSDALVILAQLNAENKDFADAQKVLDSALIISPTSASAWRTQGDFFIRENKLAEAEAALKKAIEYSKPKTPHYGYANASLATVYLKQNQIDRAKGCIQKALEFDSNNSAFVKLAKSIDTAANNK